MQLGPFPRTLPCVLLFFGFAWFTQAALSQTFQFKATTTLSAETANNTSAADSFTALSNGDAAAGNVSKLPIRDLLYSGSTTSIYAHFLPWFGQSNHTNVGYNSDDPTQVKKQVDDMLSRGIQGSIVDWYGQYKTFEDNTTQLVRNEAETRGGKFVFAVMEDVGALNKCASTAGCSVTQTLINDISYANTMYFQSSAYMVINGRPVLFFFGVDKYTIDWTAVRNAANTTGNPYFIFQGTNGFTHVYSDGAFSWISVNTSNADDEGLSYLDNFYNAAHSYSGDLVFGSAYPGFNDSLAPWRAGQTPRIMNQHCGQTWVDSLGRTGNHYSSTDQLKALQIVTWNDYEEGTEIESGIDNCIAVSGSTSGASFNWTLSGSGKENTIDHYTVFISEDGSNLMALGNVASGTHTFDLSKLGLDPSKQYYLYVKAGGVPSIHNQMSASVTYQATNQPPTAVLSVTPASGNAPLTVTASTSGASDVDGSIASSSINWGDGSAASAGPTASHTYNTAGTYTVTATVTDNLGASSTAKQTVTVSTAGCTLSTVNRTITICTPAANSTVSSPVHVVAYATDSKAVSKMVVYVDSRAKYTALNTKSVDAYITMTTGSHKLKVGAYDGGWFSKTITITVK